MSQQVTVFLQFDQSVLVKESVVRVSHVANVTSVDKAMKQKVMDLVLYCFPEGKQEKQAFSVLKVIGLIGQAFPEIEVNPIGEPDFIVEYEPEKQKKFGKGMEWVKTLFVALAVFFGSAFTIISFNKDASVDEIFSLIYRLTEGAERTGPGELEIGYSLGLPLGIILFFNHFLRKKIDSDPTPLQIQMRQYEKDVNSTIIENATREGKKKNV